MVLTAGHVASMMRKHMPLGHKLLMDELYQYTQSSKRNMDVLRDWCEESARVLIGWHYLKNTLTYHRDPEGAIDGLLMWYRCTDEWGWKDIQDWKADDPEGDTFFLAFCWAGAGAMKDLCLELIRRQPEVLTHKLVSIREGRRGPGVVKYTQKLFVKILNQRDHGKRKRSTTTTSSS
tara:strand:- start:11301 stop:11831 length:531 start_codon:yes stop_codon:yes gene_type:complete